MACGTSPSDYLGVICRVPSASPSAQLGGLPEQLLVILRLLAEVVVLNALRHRLALQEGSNLEERNFRLGKTS